MAAAAPPAKPATPEEERELHLEKNVKAVVDIAVAVAGMSGRSVGVPKLKMRKVSEEVRQLGKKMERSTEDMIGKMTEFSRKRVEVVRVFQQNVDKLDRMMALISAAKSSQQNARKLMARLEKENQQVIEAERMAGVEACGQWERAAEEAEMSLTRLIKDVEHEASKLSRKIFGIGWASLQLVGGLVIVGVCFYFPQVVVLPTVIASVVTIDQVIMSTTNFLISHVISSAFNWGMRRRFQKKVETLEKGLQGSLLEDMQTIRERMTKIQTLVQEMEVQMEGLLQVLRQEAEERRIYAKYLLEWFAEERGDVAHHLARDGKVAETIAMVSQSLEEVKRLLQEEAAKASEADEHWQEKHFDLLLPYDEILTQ